MKFICILWKFTSALCKETSRSRNSSSLSIDMYFYLVKLYLYLVQFVFLFGSNCISIWFKLYFYLVQIVFVLGSNCICNFRTNSTKTHSLICVSRSYCLILYWTLSSHKGRWSNVLAMDIVSRPRPKVSGLKGTDVTMMTRLVTTVTRITYISMNKIINFNGDWNVMGKPVFLWIMKTFTLQPAVPYSFS